ncbi:MAG: flap endonuclease Xni [Pseudoalteromonas spongiae]|uniref:flap endonuclease Xni n=1 Tax=Pseudoalteromonas TaxID=53246 RepID=UPI000CF6B296|nr:MULTISPECIES: flap endonuclease Xni [Pseudoalteromonas]TMO84608.1 flap endonuclease Xni [Pseudoalteromonas spongiae]
MATHLLLIDALNLIRRIYAVDSQQAGNDANLAAKNTYFRVVNAARKLLKNTNATHAIAVFDGDTSWRYHYYADYKQSRKPMPNELADALPKLYQAFSELGITVYVPEHDEADDVIATLASKASTNKVTSTIVSTDKGFLPLLGDYIHVYDYFKSEYISIQSVIDKFSLAPSQLTDFWALNGDKTNDIPGVSGIGKQGAVNLLTQFPSVEDALLATDYPDELKRVFNKLNDNHDAYIRAKLLVSLRQDIHLGFSLKALRLPSS